VGKQSREEVEGELVKTLVVKKMETTLSVVHINYSLQGPPPLLFVGQIRSITHLVTKFQQLIENWMGSVNSHLHVLCVKNLDSK